MRTLRLVGIPSARAPRAGAAPICQGALGKLMIVLRSPAVAEAVHRCVAIEQRLESAKSIQAAPGTKRFDAAVHTAVKATGWPEHKARQAMIRAVAAGQLIAHDHECAALTKLPHELQDHDVIRDADLSQWLQRLSAGTTTAQSLRLEQEATPGEPNAAPCPAAEGETRRLESTDCPATFDSTSTIPEVTLRPRTKTELRLHAISACIRQHGWPPMQLPHGAKKQIQSFVEGELPELFPERPNPKDAVFHDAWKQGSGVLFASITRLANAGSRA